MSRSARSQFKSASKLRDRAIEQEALSQIRDFLEGCLGSDDSKPWDLSQEEAKEIHENRQEFPIEGKSAGARYIAARINSGADPDLYQLTMDWFAHRNIKRELSKEELAEIGASAMDLRMLGIEGQREAREFYKLYREVFVKGAGWGSCYQPNHYRVKAIATTPNYNRLPLWVKKTLLNTPWIETGDRIGNIWRLIPCAKAWKHAPNLPKNLAEKVGKMSVEARYLAFWAWENACEKILSGSLKSKSIRHFYWQAYAVSRSQLIEAFWIELRRLQFLGQAEQAVGFAAHGAGHHHHLVAGARPLGHALGDVADALGRAHRRAAVLVNDQCHGCWGERGPIGGIAGCLPKFIWQCWQAHRRTF